MLKKLALMLASRKIAPGKIALTAPACNNNDFFSIWLEHKTNGHGFRCTGLSDGYYTGFIFTPNNESGIHARFKLSNLELGDWDLLISHYYKGLRFEKESVFTFLWRFVSCHHKRMFKSEAREQKRFNSKDLAMVDRAMVIQWFVEKTIDSDKFESNYVMFAHQIHSTRMFRHPDKQQTINYYHLLMESLVESGDLEKVRTSYKLTPSALISLSKYERDEQKHHDQQENARKTRALTKVIMIIGVLTLLFNVVKWLVELSDKWECFTK